MLYSLPESIGHVQGDPVLELPVEAAVLMLEERVQWASHSQLHNQDLWSWASCQQTNQAGVTETTQHRQLLEKNTQWKKVKSVKDGTKQSNYKDLLVSFFQLYLSKEPVDVKLRCMLVEYLHSHLFIFVDASIDSSKATAPCK